MTTPSRSHVRFPPWHDARRVRVGAGRAQPLNEFTGEFGVSAAEGKYRGRKGSSSLRDEIAERKGLSMAQRVQVILVCDLHDDETPGTETISFGLDGTPYEVDV